MGSIEGSVEWSGGFHSLPTAHKPPTRQTDWSRK